MALGFWHGGCSQWVLSPSHYVLIYVPQLWTKSSILRRHLSLTSRDPVEAVTLPTLDINLARQYKLMLVKDQLRWVIAVDVSFMFYVQVIDPESSGMEYRTD